MKVSMSNFEEYIAHELNGLPQSIPNSAEKYIRNIHDKAGIYYRVFARTKSVHSTINKMKKKSYGADKNVQDLLGVRVVLYFKDDIDICIKMLKAELELIDESIDDEEEDRFSPTRLNMVFNMPEQIIQLFSKTIWELPIDKTFEIQVRTIFSEGWHEVEHDLRYKNKDDWEKVPKLSRSLNGIFATLDTCDWAILHVFDELAYVKYKNDEWECMLRNHWRIHMIDDTLTDEICEIFNRDKNVAKAFYRVPRENVITCISNTNTSKVPKKMTNIIYLVNLEFVKNEDIRRLTPSALINIVRQQDDDFVKSRQ